MTILKSKFTQVNNWYQDVFDYLMSNRHKFTDQNSFNKEYYELCESIHGINDGEDIFCADHNDLIKINESIYDYGWSEEFMKIKADQYKLFVDIHIDNDNLYRGMSYLYQIIEDLSEDIKYGYYNTGFDTIRITN